MGTPYGSGAAGAEAPGNSKAVPHSPRRKNEKLAVAHNNTFGLANRSGSFSVEN